MNLQRFEDERRIFAMEKEKFDREKRHMEQMRFQRLLEFERKRSMQTREREQLAVEAAAIALAEIENQRLILTQQHRHKSKSRPGSNVVYADDYESSTATSSSSRDNDFNDFTPEIPFESSSIEPNGITPAPMIVASDTEPLIDQQPPADGGIPKQSLFFRFLFGKAKSSSTIANRMSYLHIRVDDGGPISIWRIIFVETPLVWHQVIEVHYAEWEKTIRLRNRCIANFLVLAIYFGFGGLMFRFIEGAFENFYKCGVRRVKRDFVDHLWSTSHDLRFGFVTLLLSFLLVSLNLIVILI